MPEAHDLDNARDLAARAGLPAVGQVSFAVRDLDAVLPAFTAMFGVRDVRQIELDPGLVTVRGRPADAVLKVALFRDTVPEIELIEVLSGDFLTRDSADRDGTALHHLGFYVDDVDLPVAALREIGFDVILVGSTRSGQRFRYVEAPAALGAVVFELFERNPSR